MHYRTNDGEHIRASNPRALVKELRRHNWAPGRNESEFMKEVARRVHTLKSARISTRNHHAFVQGLLRTGLLTEVNND